MSTISIVIPCYNEEASIPVFYEEISKITASLSQYDFMFMFVDDGSHDGTLKIVKELGVKDKRISYISLSRNFGKEAAMYAGMKAVTGDFIAIMDVDLQDPPYMLTEMIKILEEEYSIDVVAARRISRKGEPPIRSFFARLFYRLMNRISKTDVADGARDFRMMRKYVVDAILEVNEVNRFSKGIFGWVGFTTRWLPYENIKRVTGETKWSFFKLLTYSFDGIVAFSTKPLIISTVLGLTMFFLSFVMIAFVIIRWLLIGDPVQGWASTVCIILFVGGLQLLCTGILGQYLSKTYLETKKRPIYIIKDKNINEN